MNLSIPFCMILTVVILSMPSGGATAEPPAAEPPASDVDKGRGVDVADASESSDDSTEGRDQRFAAYMTGSKLVGRYTVLGRSNGEMPEEEYTISKCEKLPEANLFRFTARIRYGDTDTELPMDLPVLWAGDTPVITLSHLWIPGLGTFSARVVIHQDRYAGTWTHSDVGGHLFGEIRRADDAQDAETSQEDEASQ